MEPYTFYQPKTPVSGVVFASPHSGQAYDKTFGPRLPLPEHVIRSSEDACVDRLLALAPELGVPVLSANAPRAYVDLNRNSTELDPALIKGASTRFINARVASGLGVIPRVVSGGVAIYSGRLSLLEARTRLERYWHPYHTALRQTLDDTRKAFGCAVLFDWHSMPSSVVNAQPEKPDIVIGDRFGRSAESYLTDRVVRIFSENGFRVTLNTPFAGAFITEHYGKPLQKIHVIQIEINRALYMDETNVTLHKGFHDLRDRLNAVFPQLIDIYKDERSIAAE